MPTITKVKKATPTAYLIEIFIQEPRRSNVRKLLGLGVAEAELVISELEQILTFFARHLEVATHGPLPAHVAIEVGKMLAAGQKFVGHIDPLRMSPSAYTRLPLGTDDLFLNLTEWCLEVSLKLRKIENERKEKIPGTEDGTRSTSDGGARKIAVKNLHKKFKISTAAFYDAHASSPTQNGRKTFVRFLSTK